MTRPHAPALTDLTSDLPGDAIERRRSRNTALWVVLGAVVLLLALGWAIKSLSAKPAAPRRQMARISVLPDTPPPPPPPKTEKPPEPRPAPRQAQRDAPKATPDAPKPADAPLKMEGAAGTGPSAFAGGAVTQDYKGGALASGAASAPGGSTPADRAQERFYGNTARQLLRDALDLRLAGDATALLANFSLWIAADGSIRRFELQPSGNALADQDLRAALDITVRELRLPPPPASIASQNQPLRFRLTLRAG